MIRPDRIMLRAGLLLGRMTLALISLAAITGWSTPPGTYVSNSSTEPADTEQPEMAVTLQIPEGALAKHLELVDASGRELAIVSYWQAGDTTVVSKQGNDMSVSYRVSSDGSARVRIAGSARVTVIDSTPDGTVSVDEPVCGRRCSKVIVHEL
jgi:hypothetical protein